MSATGISRTLSDRTEWVAANGPIIARRAMIGRRRHVALELGEISCKFRNCPVVSYTIVNFNLALQMVEEIEFENGHF